MIKPLTSLRFIFALMVFFSHLDWVPRSDKFFSHLYDNYFSRGYIGVSFFFILSGFILALNYKNKFLQREVSFRDFWAARIARIYPIHFLTLLLSLPVFFGDIFKEPLQWILSFICQLLLIQSFIPSQDVYFGFNAVSWSISNELFYYLLFPVIIIAVYKFRKAEYLALLFVLMIPVAISLYPVTEDFFLFGINPVFRISDFIIGILLFCIYEKGVFSNWFKSRASATALEVGSIALLLVFVSFHEYIPGAFKLSTYYWIPMALMIFIFSYQSGSISKLLSSRSLIILGEISFSFYMLHGLIMRYFKAADRRLEIIPNDYVMIAIVLLSVIFASYLSHKYIEIPANRFWRTRLTRVKVITQRPEVPVMTAKESTLMATSQKTKTVKY